MNTQNGGEQPIAVKHRCHAGFFIVFGGEVFQEKDDLAVGMDGIVSTEKKRSNSWKMCSHSHGLAKHPIGNLETIA